MIKNNTNECKTVNHYDSTELYPTVIKLPLSLLLLFQKIDIILPSDDYNLQIPDSGIVAEALSLELRLLWANKTAGWW